MKARHTFALAALFAASLALAQAGKPYQSTFQDYRPYADGAPGDWRAINQSVSTAQAGTGGHDHGAAKAAPGSHDHGSAGGDGGATAHDHGGGHMHKGMDHKAMQKMHEQHMHKGSKGPHQGHGAAEKKQ